MGLLEQVKKFEEQKLEIENIKNIEHSKEKSLEDNFCKELFKSLREGDLGDILKNNYLPKSQSDAENIEKISILDLLEMRKDKRDSKKIISFYEDSKDLSFRGSQNYNYTYNHRVGDKERLILRAVDSEGNTSDIFIYSQIKNTSFYNYLPPTYNYRDRYYEHVDVLDILEIKESKNKPNNQILDQLKNFLGISEEKYEEKDIEINKIFNLCYTLNDNEYVLTPRGYKESLQIFETDFPLNKKEQFGKFFFETRILNKGQKRKLEEGVLGCSLLNENDESILYLQSKSLNLFNIRTNKFRVIERKNTGYKILIPIGDKILCDGDFKWGDFKFGFLDPLTQEYKVVHQEEGSVKSGILLGSKIIYSKTIDRKNDLPRSDFLLSFDLKTKKVEVLAQEDNSINTIFPFKDKIIYGGWFSKNKNFFERNSDLVMFNLENKKSEVILTEGANLHFTALNTFNDKIIYAVADTLMRNSPSCLKLYDPITKRNQDLAEEEGEINAITILNGKILYGGGFKNNLGYPLISLNPKTKKKKILLNSSETIYRIATLKNCLPIAQNER